MVLSLTFEHFGDPRHGIVADQDRRDEGHVSPHEKTEEQSTGTLNKVQPRRPMTFSRPLIQSNSGNDIHIAIHDIAPLQDVILLKKPMNASILRLCSGQARLSRNGKSPMISPLLRSS
jgi:hypothetical protein